MQKNSVVAVKVVFTYVNKDVSALILIPPRIQIHQYLLKSISHRIKTLSKKIQPTIDSVSTTKEVLGGQEKSQRANGSERLEMLSEPKEPAFHSSDTPMPPPPKSELDDDHPFVGKVVDTHEVQLVKPRVPHPVTHAHAMQCLTLVNDIEALAIDKEDELHHNITDKLKKWLCLCPPGFSWHLTFDNADKHKQAITLAKSVTEILNLRVRREALARVMAQINMDVTAKGMFKFVKYDIESEFQLLSKSSAVSCLWSSWARG